MNSLYSAITAARNAAAQKDFDAAISILDEVANEGAFSAEYLQLKSRFVQLSEQSKYTLEDAEMFLVNAQGLAPLNAEILIDLGYFYSRILVNNEKARVYFFKACELLRRQYAEALAGVVETMRDVPHLADQAVEKELTELRGAIADCL